MVCRIDFRPESDDLRACRLAHENQVFPVIAPGARPTATGVENQGLSTTSLRARSGFVPLPVPEGLLVSSGRYRLRRPPGDRACTAPGVLVVRDAGEQPAHFDRSRQLAVLLIDGANRGGIGFGDDKHGGEDDRGRCTGQGQPSGGGLPPDDWSATQPIVAQGPACRPSRTPPLTSARCPWT